ncbi:olfactory receptor 2J2-like [Alosa sapidissima]|uniref:olfactory receptor 2J2-like n=1 Tax=Alosa sapidissima TaxID=34773 RepID=UPI001C080DE5|nr:olfactory receptor 2J2-like [Alosa sapidissima]
MGNISTFKFFILFGLQESGVYKPLYFLLVVVLYILIIIVNLTLIFIVTVDKSLHEPMYIFISNLCANGLYGTVGFYPKILLDLRSDIHMISYSWCMIQTYVIYSSALCEMSVLTVMSYDRYVAICRPLQYHSILTPHAVLKLLLVFILISYANIIHVCISISDVQPALRHTNTETSA